MTNPQCEAVIVIPARLESTRLPGKLLLNESGKPLIQHTYESASQSRLGRSVFVATDSEEIAACVRGFGGEVLMTGAGHQSGSARIAEVAGGLEAPLIVNVQGDEPEISGEAIDLAIQGLNENSQAVVGTLACPIRTQEELLDSSVVKVVVDARSNALYFSRSPIPFVRDASSSLSVRDSRPRHLRHIGLYVYRRDFLVQLPDLPASMLASTESLEQLSFLEAGFRVHVCLVDDHAAGIDTPDDYRAFVSRHRS